MYSMYEKHNQELRPAIQKICDTSPKRIGADKIRQQLMTQNFSVSRVAAYVRVSSDSEDQLNSFAAQNHYYTSLISAKENWDMVDIYADRGITGTSAEKRDDFQRMLSDCRRGLIDRVLCKSISRFARNTTECLEAIRELKSLGIGITFEKEHIDTTKMSGEMLTAGYTDADEKWNFQYLQKPIWIQTEWK